MFGQRSVGLVVTNVGEAGITCRLEGGFRGCGVGIVLYRRGVRCGAQEECLGRGR